MTDKNEIGVAPEDGSVFVDSKEDDVLEIPPGREDDIVFVDESHPISIGRGDRLSGFNLLNFNQRLSEEEQEKIDEALDEVEVDVDEIVAELEGNLDVGDETDDDSQ